MTARWVIDYLRGEPGSKETLIGLLQASRHNFEVLQARCDDEGLMAACEKIIAGYRAVESEVAATTRARVRP